MKVRVISDNIIVDMRNVDIDGEDIFAASAWEREYRETSSLTNLRFVWVH